MAGARWDFLDHPGSSVAAEIAGYDWAGTPLGPIDGWPVSLRAMLANMLACPVPMYLVWGPQLLSFYNDSYAPILGYRAPSALARPFRELWASVWDEISPLVDAALAGRSTSVTDMKLDLARSGAPEESYWSFSFSPAYDDHGRIGGMWCVTGETTSRVVAERERAEADKRLDMALSAGHSIGVWDWNVADDRVVADPRFAALYGVDANAAATGVPLAAFMDGVHPDDVERVRGEIATALADGTTFVSEYRIVGDDGNVRWVSAQGRGIFDDDGVCVRFPGVSYDVTGRKSAEMALRAAKEERDFVIELTSRHRLLDDPEAVVRATSEALGRRLGVNRVGFYRLLGPDRMHHITGWGDGVLMPLRGEQPSGAFGSYAQGERSAGRTIVFSDSRHEYDGDLTGYAREGVLSGICVPLMEGGRWAAGIFLHHAAVRHWTAAEISLAKEIAGLTWLAIERAEAVVRLKQRIDRQATALTEAADEIAAQATGRVAAETLVRQLQKMEAVGQLTGGIAHDFNNMLAVIISGLNITQRRLARGDTDVAKYIDGALEGANRAAALTHRLLAFSRQQPLSPEPIDTNRLVAGMTELLGRSLGETVRLETVLGAGLWKANADPNQLENVIINLAVNSRDAMPDGGRLTIETANAHVDDDYALEADIEPGQYVMIAVTDTGTGMSEDVIGRAFEPFFTTKGVGKGTGLGLSQVFGFVRQSGGHVRIYSEVGVGTTIRLYLPRFWGEEAPTIARRPSSLSRRGSPSEVILVVEDEERVRNTSVEALRELGYSVLQAASGAEALALLAGERDVTLLFTDIVMPEMTGRQLSDRAVALRPTLKVIYTTGYTRNAVVHNGVLDPGTNFLPKPFTLDQLAAKVRDVLDN